MTWQQFILSLESLEPASVEEALLELGAASVTYSDAADDPVLEPGVGETPLWNRTRITALFDDSITVDRIVDSLCAALGLPELPEHRLETLEDRDWEREWMVDLAPMRFGRRLWICPGDQDLGVEGAVTVQLDPGLAFGTGTHPTTAMCLEWLDQLDLGGARVLDYGCGSGVLAVAAMKLGAASADGIDIDPQALLATEQNARRNSVTVGIIDDPAAISGQYDVLLANILAGPLVELANQLSEYVKSDGRLALSGVLEKQAASVRKAYEHRIEFEEQKEMHQDGQTWVRLSGRRIAS
ncbi:MAG: 50S ribosomal protein L11 methyltransferase [Woeseiaceae bacterium]|nr:50S ribosomal protein L11 methyltransferase [Woeseiaceae bacterium]